MIAVIIKSVRPIFTYNQDYSLPLEIWHPYSIKNAKNFFMTYIFELVAGIPLVSSHTGLDSFYFGIVLRLCTQIKVLKHRLRNLVSFNQDNEFVKVNDEECEKKISIYVEKHIIILE